MDEPRVYQPSSRWLQSTFAAILALGMLWLLGMGLVRGIVFASEAGRGFQCGSGSRTLETGQVLKHHPNGCGWVPVIQSETDTSLPYVSSRAFVGHGVIIRDNVRVPGWADIRGVTTLSGDTVVPPGTRIRDGEVQTYAFLTTTAR